MPILYTSERDASNNRYEHRVLSKEVNHSYQIMSDIWGTADYALVWDDATASPKKFVVNIYDMNPSDWRPAEIVVDATPEILEKYRAWRVQLAFERLVDSAKDESMRIVKGSVAEVVRGRNGKGTIGKVVVVMSALYGMGYRAYRMEKYAIATSDVQIDKPLANGRTMRVYRDVVWAWSKNVRRVDIAKIDLDALRKQAEEQVARSA